MVRSRQHFDDLDEFVRQKHASLAKRLRPLHPWDQADVLADAIYQWAGRGQGLSRAEADDVALVLTTLSLRDWTVSAVARLAIRLVWGAKRNPFGASLPDYWDPRIFGVSESTLRRHQDEGLNYGYERLAREIDVERLVAKGRSESAARRWLQRANETRPPYAALHWWDAPKPRPRKLRGVAVRPAPETRRTRRAGRTAA